jgi:hypothetical protein
MNHAALDIAFDVAPSIPRSILSMMVFTVVSLGLYAYASYELDHEALPLQARCDELTEKLTAMRQATKELNQIVESLSDPAADEYALITELGRIPEGSRVMILSPPKRSDA